MTDNPPPPISGNSADADRRRPTRSASQTSRTSEQSKHSQSSSHSESRHKQSKVVASTASIRSQQSKHSDGSAHAEESTPLLQPDANHPNYGNGPANRNDPATIATSSLQALQNFEPGKGNGRRWPTIVALVLLSLTITTILVLGFAAPEIVDEYAKEATVFNPVFLSIESFTSSGVKARIQGDFTVDASRVHKKPVRDLGRFGTWIAQAVQSKNSEVKVYLPEYGEVLLGTAYVPGIVVDIRDGHTTRVDFVCDLVAGDIDGVRAILNDWIEGRLGQLRVQGVGKVGLKSGLFSLGDYQFTRSLVFQDNDLPTIPEYHITKLNFREAQHGQKGMAADVSLALKNDFPVALTLPPLEFNILVQGCSPNQPYILLADAKTSKVEVEPKEDVYVDVSGIIRELPETFVTACPESEKSPLDLLLGNYMHGDETTIYICGSESLSGDTPKWITDFLRGIVLPLPFPGHTFDRLIRDFSLANVHLSLPDPIASPDSPRYQLRLSATVEALVNLPEEMNFHIEVSRVRAEADVFYKEGKLGSLDLRKWQQAKSTRIDAHGKTPAGLAVESLVKNAPLNITDDNVFADLLQALLFGEKGIVLGVKAKVEVEIETALGKFVVRDLPAEGKVFVKPLSGGGSNVSHVLSPEIGALNIVSTSPTSLSLAAKINLTNPTEYSAVVPYIDVHLLVNDTIIGNATATNVELEPGFNRDLSVTALWNPQDREVGRELLSKFISGQNTSIAIRTHAGTIPTQPRLGKALSLITIELPTPHLHSPKNPDHDGDDDQDPNDPHFIEDATMHLLFSHLTLTTLSPLHVPLLITSLNASAYLHNTSILLGQILYHSPFSIPPGVSQSPRLPVQWNLDDVGYDTVKKALGGKLRVRAEAEVGVGVGEWREVVMYEGRGVGVKVRWF